MKFLSQIVTAASGSIAGCTYAHNRYGNYIRSRTLPVNPKSPGQVAIRNFFAGLAAIWASQLTQPQRNAWALYAANVPTGNGIFGPQFVTGLNWFIACNTLRLQAGLTRIDIAPALFSLAGITAPIIAPSATLTPVVFLNTDLWATAIGGFLACYFSPPQSPTHTFYGGSYRYAGKVAGAVVPPTSPASMNLPFPGIAGQRIFARFVAENADGRKSPAILTSGVIV
jgi:hypothetical protein